MPPSIDGDASPHSPPTLTAGPDRVGTSREAVSAAEIAATQRRNDRINHNFNATVQMFEYLSQCIFETNELRDYQKRALVRCIDPMYNDSKLLLITRTGSGKSHIMRTLGVAMNGIVVIFIPLLSLSADQMVKMKEAKQLLGSVETHHLDELPTNDGGESLQKIVNRMSQLQEETTSTMFLFLSPQFLCKKSSKPLLDALIAAYERKVLRVVGIDEAHLFVLHSNFRLEIRMLKDLFFKKVFDEKNPKSHPIFLAMTATMPSNFVAKLEALTTVQLPSRRILRGSLNHFQQRGIKFEYFVRDSLFAGLDQLVEVIKRTEADRVVVLTTLAATAIALEKKLKEKLNAAGCTVDIMLVHGQLDKFDKFFNIRLFCGKTEFEFLSPRCLVTNGAGNTGIDSDSITEMLRSGFPMDLLTVLQERGRLVRKDGMEGRIRFLCNVKSLLQNIHLLHELHSQHDGSTVPDEHVGFASAIQHSNVFTKEAQQNSNAGDYYKKLRQKCKLELQKEKDMLLDEKRVMLLEVLKFFCLRGGCYHARAEDYLHTGKLHVIDPTTRCNNKQCSMCDGSWATLHKRVNKRALVSWFQIEFPKFVSTENASSLTDLLWNGKEKWIKTVFRVKKKSSLCKYHVESLMLSLIAAEIITWKVSKDKIVWFLNKIETDDGGDEDEKIEECCYLIDAYWDGIPLH